MASVTTGYHATGWFDCQVSGLQYPAYQYSSFRFRLVVDGSLKEERNTTDASSSNGTSVQYNYNHLSGHSSAPGSYYSDVYATKGGVEYYIGRG